MRKTKILMTIGPGAMNHLEQLVPKVDGVRMNFSHGTHQSHQKEITRVKELSDTLPLMLDTAGPEVRVEKPLEVGPKPVPCDQLKTTVPLNLVEKDVILADDGKFKLVVTKEGLVCNSPGRIRKGAKVIVHNKDVDLPTLTKQDIKDIKFGVKQGIDIVAMSFVRTPEDVIQANTLLRDLGAEDVTVVVKIEHWKALENIREIVKLSDGVMVARGDLAVELPYQKVPSIQKKLVGMCVGMRRPTIVATQMLHSMMHSPSPTRAELSDVANAVLDGADAVMLSGETSIGEYPVEAVEVMHNIIRETEKQVQNKCKPLNISEEMAFSAGHIAEKLGAQLFCETNTGRTARRISKFRPSVPIYVKTSPRRARQLRLLWGVQEGQPGKGYVVHVEHLADHPGIKVEFKGKVLARGESYGTGMVMGEVGKGILSLDRRNKQLPDSQQAPLGVLYYGRENDPLLQECIRRSVPAIIPDSRVEVGTRVVVDFEFGIIMPGGDSRSKYSHILARFPQLDQSRYSGF